MKWNNNLHNVKIWIIKNKNNLLWILFVLIVVNMFLMSQICIVFVKTNSIPYKICLQMINVLPQKHDLCAFMYKQHKFIKYIAGIEGDKVVNLDNVIYVDGVKIGKAKKTDQLTPIDTGVIPKGYVFVSGNHPKSLDSRYKEFGLIRASALNGKVLGIKKWEATETSNLN